MRSLARLVAGLLLVLSTVAGALVLTSGPAAACSCVEPTIDFLDEHDVAFFGVVAKLREAGGTPIATFRTESVFKGEVTRRVDVVGDEANSTCGLDPNEGDRLLVFGQLVEGEVRSNTCSAVPANGEAGRSILAELGEGTEPSPGYMKAERGRLGLTYDQFVAGRAVLGVLGLTFLAYFAYRFWLARRRTA
ncbi:MAG: hypothetical protein JWN68_678 [Nocardioides sp.]|uniref:hypothetical protein n=1 Tax=Nocardioides sp. TaxID=35761 RepID=UPI0026097818|nr:hypothetical protein [Nocardioides sp.]MCW2832725.1 hypothetical protein [Nocardioides sp.]